MLTHEHLPGVVLFDNPDMRESGWACSAGSEPFAITDTASLSSNSVWWTNVPWELFGRAGLNRTNRFREPGYLRPPMIAIAAEYGIGDMTGAIRQLAGRDHTRRLCDVFAAVMQASWAFDVRGFPANALRIGYRQSHYQEPKPEVLPIEVEKGLASANQPFTFSERKNVRGFGPPAPILSLTRHRYTHCFQVLAGQVPDGKWSRVPLMSDAEIRAHTRPLLLKVSVDALSSDLGRLLNFGGLNERSRTSMGRRVTEAVSREWMTAVEFNYLSERGKVTVTEIWEAERYIDNPLFETMVRDRPEFQVSPAFLLAYENLWSCALKTLANRADNSAIAIWMQAYDRILLLDDAMHILDKDPDSDITFFSYGRIAIRRHLPEDVSMTPWFANVVRGTFLIPPLCDQDPGPYEIYDETNMVELYQALQFEGRAEALVDCDQFALQTALSKAA